MKKILITGAGSYIGESFKNYILDNFENYNVTILDMLDKDWIKADFSGFDSVFHVAGIAHIKETKENSHLYFDVNCDLAFEVAKKAKEGKIPQFVFLSSMSVYGMDEGVITKDTEPDPSSSYGKSKLMAEEKILSLADADFNIAILRPPMVYGKNCKGNFQFLKKLSEKLPVFPRISNRRSMIYIESLCEFVRLIIDNKKKGIFFPQNKEYVCTGDIVRAISEVNNKKMYFSFILGTGVKILMPFISKLKKAFGTLIYDIEDEFDFSYCEKENYESYKKSI